MDALVIDMWIEIGCPRSHISLVELQRAIEGTGRVVEFCFHNLRIDPDAPTDYGQTTIDYLCEALSIDVAAAEEILQVVEEAGAKAALGFNFNIARGVNSLDVHHLFRCIQGYGKHVEVAVALFTAHFEQEIVQTPTFCLMVAGRS